jgi:hypothetical protein
VVYKLCYYFALLLKFPLSSNVMKLIYTLPACAFYIALLSLPTQAQGTTSRLLNMQVGATVNLPAGGVPSDLAVADFDGDGAFDFAVAQQGLNAISVFRQQPAGAFTGVPTTYTLGESPSAMLSFAYDPDRRPNDLIVACSAANNGGRCLVLHNHPSVPGVLTLRQSFIFNSAVPAPQAHLALGFIDNDQEPDVLVSLEAGPGLNGVKAAFYRGNNGWTIAGSATTQGFPSGVALEDMDGDAFTDAIATMPSANQVRVFKHSGLPTSTQPYSFATYTNVPTLGVRPIDVATADLNHDSRPDLVVANEGDNTVSVILTTGPMRFGTAVILQQAAAPRQVLLYDFNNDSYADLVTINANNTISFYQNTAQPGPNRFGTPLTLPTGPNPVAMRYGDFDGDLQQDVAVACAGDNTVRLFRNVTQPLAIHKAQPVRANVYPNPATDQLTIDLPRQVAGAVRVQLHDPVGRVIMEQTLPSVTSSLTLPTAELPRGLYLLKVITEEGNLAQRVLLR